MNCPTCGAALAAADLEQPNCRFCGAVHPHVATARAQVEGLRQVMGLPAVPGIGGQAAYPPYQAHQPHQAPYLAPMPFAPPALLPAPRPARGAAIVPLLAGGIAVAGAVVGVLVALGASTGLGADDSAARQCAAAVKSCDAEEQAVGKTAFMSSPHFEGCLKARMGAKIANGTHPQRAMAKKYCAEAAR